jgi:ribosomal protein S12 methylthiotransferase accessory factor
MEIPVTLTDGRVVEATIGDFKVRTDQPEKTGGTGTAPSPSDLFLVSIAACAGYYVLDFCLERKIPTDGIGVVMRTHKNQQSKLLDLIELEIKVPPGFPEKYEKAVVRAADLCWVKKNIQTAPAFETRIVK